jgi:hypothetical protein
VATHPDPVSVATTIDAPPARVYALVADLTRMGELSPESNGCTWTHGATGAAPGARFIGRNLRGRRGGVIKVLGGLTTGVWNRSDHNRAGMVTTLERLQRAAERPKPAGGPANDA